MSTTERLVQTGRTHTTGGRDGAARSSDGRLAVALSRPGTPGTGTNPEQLLAAGWSASFLDALQIAAVERGVRLPPGAAIDAEVHLYRDEDASFLRARLHVSLPDVLRPLAQVLVRAAHETCPYSKATRGNVDVAITVA
ncbi:organic hydroperoxide resistance protein [Salinarimonas soli]|uniref:Organic hydroperoxide resistance protein n=1 Tax=Salinarimonas soli TaxID=1638099 RepID=A0A5B2VI10_9HYPH|nr:organic hydroperoxide resistance protein [Salinarimonas soli]KAA2238258.1 organic hydroperoxide resistance protein [Salinarimonas soli]